MKKVILLLIFSILSTPLLYAQAVTNVNKEVDRLRVFEKVVEDGYGTPRLYRQLADGYYFKSDYRNASKWFKRLFASEGGEFVSDPQVRRRYRQSLKALGTDVKEIDALLTPGHKQGMANGASKSVDQSGSQK